MSVHFAPEPSERHRPLRTLLRRLIPRDRRFFSLFSRQVQLAVEAVEALAALLADLRDPDGRVREIEALEKRADGVVEETRVLLRRSLVPPFPRQAIHSLINKLDDVLDLTEDVAQSVHLYHVTRVTEDAQRLAELAVQATRRLQQAVEQLQADGDPHFVIGIVQEVDALEAQADHVMRAAMSKLFREEPDARELVKLRAIYELLEQLTDNCKHAAADVEALALR
jgi:uncharacterized protein